MPSLKIHVILAAALLVALPAVAAPAQPGQLVTASVAPADDTEPPRITALYVEDDTLEETAEAIITIAADERETGGSGLNELEITIGDSVVYAGPAIYGGSGDVTQRTFYRSVGTGTGERPICARVSDDANNWSEPTCLTVLVAPEAAPIVRDVAVTPDVVGLGESFTVTGVADDTETGDSAVRESLINVNGVCCTGGGWFGIEASYYEFSETIRGVNMPGEAQVCVTAYDALGNGSEEICVPLLVVDDQAPELSGLDAGRASYEEGEPITVTASATDARHGRSPIAAVDLTVDGAAAGAMQAVDGAVDEVEEDLTATLSGLAVGNHEICAIASDVAGNATAPACTGVTVFETTPPLIVDLAVSGTPAAGELTEIRAIIDDRTTGGSRILSGRLVDGDGTLLGLLEPVDGSFDSTVEEVRGQARFWQAGTYEVCAIAQDEHATTGGTDCITIEVLPRAAVGSGTLTSSLTPIGAESSFEVNLQEQPEATGAGWLGTLRYDDGPMSFVAQDTADIVVDGTSAIVTGSGTRNGVESCDFQAVLTEGDVAAGSSPAFELLLWCTAGSLTGQPDYSTTNPDLKTGAIDVRGVTQ